MRVLTINFDLDGVVVRFEAEMMKLTEGYTGRRLAPWTKWAIHSAWEMDSSEWYEHFERSVFDGVFRTADPMPGALPVLHRMLDSDHRVRFVTSKVLHNPAATYKAIQDCTAWLDQYGLLRNNVELCYTHNKQGYIADVIVDDKPDLSWVQGGATNILFGQPWNDGVDEFSFNTEAGGSLIRARGWDQVEQIITDLANA
jgi:5'(3')-deoxyribonucleotidase